MLHGFRRSFGTIAHACSDFGHYFMKLQHPCFESGKGNDCEGAPGIQEAQRDYRAMMRARYPHLLP